MACTQPLFRQSDEVKTMIAIRHSLPSILPLLLWTAAVADIAPVPGTQLLAPVFNRADLVCSCVVRSTTVVSTQQVGSIQKPVLRRNMIAILQVLDTYKGAAPSGEAHLEYIDERPITSASEAVYLKNGQAALWFLQAKASGTYAFGDRFLGAAYLHQPLPSASGTGIEKLETALALVVQRSNREDQLTALRLLQGLEEPRPQTVAVVTALLASPDPDIALSAIAVLLKTKRADAVQQLKDYLTTYSGTAEPIALWSIGAELGQITDQKALPAIQALTTSRFLSIRLGAMDALRASRDETNAPTLIRRLDDANSDIQYLAVITLAETFRKDADYAPSMYQFEQNRERYIGLWKSWWRQGGQ